MNSHEIDPTQFIPLEEEISFRREKHAILTDPPMVSGIEATWLTQNDLVLGIEHNGEARAYPVIQIAYHHIINDTMGGDSYLVTF